jgi:fido (protein-threonine AMPylation protein)
MLTPEEIAWLLGCMDEVSKTVWNIAEHGGEAKLGATRVTERLQERHPFLHGAGLRQAVFLVNYYAWHEGYDQ